MALEQEKLGHNDVQGDDTVTEAEKRLYKMLEEEKELGRAILIDEERLVTRINGRAAHIRSYEEEVQRRRKSIVPTLKDYVGYLIVLVPVALVVNLLVLHMSELYGWGYYEWFDALVESAEAALTTAGGGSGPLNMAGKALWLLIEIVVGITIALPLEILQFLQIIIPDAQVLMGIVEGLIVTVFVFLALRYSPYGTYLDERRQIDRSYAESADELQREKQQLQEEREELEWIRSTPLYKSADAERRYQEELDRDRRKLRELFDKAKDSNEG